MNALSLPKQVICSRENRCIVHLFLQLVGNYSTRSMESLLWSSRTMIVFYRCVSSRDPLFLGRSPSPVFTARNGPNFPATDLYPDRIRCLKSNTTIVSQRLGYVERSRRYVDPLLQACRLPRPALHAALTLSFRSSTCINHS
jgi:hypothetical protein